MKLSASTIGKTAIIAAIVLLTTLSAWSKELVIAKDGKSNYQIVLASKMPNKQISNRLKQVARLIQNAFKTNGCDLAIVNEKSRKPSMPGIYLGNTAFARANGVNVKQLKDWSYIHKVVGKNLIIAGRDEPSPAKEKNINPNKRPNYRIGTEKGVADFLRQYGGVRFLYPSNGPDDRNAIEFGKCSSIQVPANLNIVKKPMLIVNYSGKRDNSHYHIANNYFPRVDLLGAAHSYGDAIPVIKYAKTNPEYFALVGGVRFSSTKPRFNNRNYSKEKALKKWRRRMQYCISNPNVGRLLYEYILGEFDNGYNMVVLGLMDSFKKCECENCKKFFNTGDDWTEKIWLFHRDICQKLLRVRPDKKVLVLAYSISKNPPKTFTKFPKNMMVQLASYNESNWKDWNKMSIQGGFVVFVYNWGTYHCAGGYTPKRTAKHVELQVKRFSKHSVLGIYKDGFGELFGLEGPVYYTYGRMFDDPGNNTSEALLEEFCAAAFGAAKTPAIRFYKRLYNAIKYYSDEIGIKSPNWKKTTRDSFKLVQSLYNQELIAALEKDLRAAEKAADSSRAKRRLRLVRWEFNYLKSLTAVVNLYYQHKDRPTDKEVFKKLLDAIDARTAEIKLICDREQRIKIDKDKAWSYSLFPPAGHNARHLQMQDKKYRSNFKKTAINWDTKAMRKKEGISKPIVKSGGFTVPVADFD